MRKDVRNEIIRIGGENINKSEIARMLGCSRQIIYNREERLKNPKPRKKIVRASKLDPYKEIIDTKLDKYRCKGMNVYKFIKKQGYTGGYGIVRKYISEYKKEQIKKATIRFETIPGLQAQVDWKESMKLVNKHGELFEINIFLMILGYSRYKYIKLTSDRSQNTLFECMVGAFGYFNGCPREILFDNMRTVVDKARTTMTEVVFNKRFKEFSNDAGFSPLVCMGYRPTTKGKVETLARIMERLRPYNEEFAKVIRSHWSIENNLHWILDVHFREDWSLCKEENALKNLSIIRKICYNLTKLDPINTKLSFKKKLTLYNHNLDNIKRLIFNVIPTQY